MIKFRLVIIAVFSLIIAFSCKEKVRNKSILPPKSDSVKKLIITLNKSSKSKEEKQEILDDTYFNVSRTTDDTLKTEFLSKIAYQYYKLGEYEAFKKTNKEALDLATELKDSVIIADSYWHYANYYKKREVFDSAYTYYNSANKYFERLKQDYLSAKMIFGMGLIKYRYRDYLGSEILIVRAISKYKKFDVKKPLYASYNLLSTNYKELNDYERAKFYRKKSLEYLDISNDKQTLYEGNLNNLGLIYTEEKAYDKAIAEFDKALENDVDLKNKNAQLYARLIDNRAYARLLKGETKDVEKELLEALAIREQEKSKAGLSVNKLHLSDYYKTVGQKKKALKHAEDASILSKEISINDEYLKALLQLSKLDNKKSNFYLNEYIKVSDSLTNVERNIQNKFARIDYETDEYIEENKRLAQQKIWLLFSSFGLLLTVSLFFYANIQKTRNKSLRLQAERQKANEKILVLTLKQQTKLEEGRMRERNRLAEELHDGVLGKLFGTRVGLGFLNLQGDEKTIKQYEAFQEELQDIEKEIRAVSHDLKSDDSATKASFTTLVNKLIENRSKIGNFTYKVEFSKFINWNKIDEHVRVNLYRILQEALQNIVKYAKADLVKLTFDIKGDNIVMTIKDNGIGFKKKNVHEGIGLSNMDSRMNRLHGTFDIESKPNKGTKIKCIIPLNSINHEGQQV